MNKCDSKNGWKEDSLQKWMMFKNEKKVVLSDKKSALQRFYLKVKQSSTRMVSL